MGRSNITQVSWLRLKWSSETIGTQNNDAAAIRVPSEKRSIPLYLRSSRPLELDLILKKLMSGLHLRRQTRSGCLADLPAAVLDVEDGQDRLVRSMCQRAQEEKGVLSTPTRYPFVVWSRVAPGWWFYLVCTLEKPIRVNKLGDLEIWITS